MLFSASTGTVHYVTIQSDDTIRWRNSTLDYETTPVFRDSSAWYHLVFKWDTTNGTAADRAIIYVNGEQVTAYDIKTNASSSENSAWNNNEIQNIGRYAATGTFNYDGYLADTYSIDGTALDPTSFGEFKNGVWIPKRYTGSYGTNGFHLEYDGNANDSSGTGNNWTATNIVAGDYMLDSPTNNYATLNPLAPSGGTFSNGNLSWSSATTDGRFALSTISPSTDGKWYCEVNIGSKASTYWTVGLFAYPATALPRILYRSDGEIYLDGSNVATVSSFTQNDVIGMAYDGSTRSLTLYKNNTSLGSWTASSTTINYFFGCASDSSGSSANYTLNFGQSGFTYTPPAGFRALSTANLPEPSISPLYGASPQDHFNTVLYTGDGTTSHAITNVGFQPDLVWVKGRNEAYYHRLTSIGLTQPNYLATNAADAESSGNNTISSLDSNGFTVDATGTGGTNESAINYVAWNWKASNATAVSNTEGTITSQVSANTTAGFSIVTYTGNVTAGATVGHGLGAIPKMIIVKSRDNATPWVVYHSGNTSAPETEYLRLNETSATADFTTWNDTAPTSSVFSLGTTTWVNATSSMLAYCFADVEGYSKFGSYTGNGSATEGPFVYTGFRPAWVMYKCSSASGDGWSIWDVDRDPINGMDRELIASSSSAEGTATDYIDFVSNGFKIRASGGSINLSGGTFIYMAFAENPFKYANAR
jgi:hypothetical protein